MSVNLIVLAAGQGTRMRSDRPKVLHEVAHAPLLHHALRSGAALAPDRSVVVVGHDGPAVAASARDFDPDIAIVEQTETKGTAHAVDQARGILADAGGDCLVLYGDTPLLRPETLLSMQAARVDHDVVVLGFDAEDPSGYGRLVVEGSRLERIVEHKDATDQERAITLCNSGVILADCAVLFALISQVGCDNAAGEYYLTDIVALAQQQGRSAGVVICPEAETLGVNSRADLARAEAAFQTRARAEALETGVTLTAPETVFFAFDTAIGRDALVEPHVIFGPGVTVETGARIRAFSHLEGAHVSRGAVVGPYARLRPGAELAEDVRVGNFVEIKGAEIGEGAKINHLSYVGDAEVGAGANIGAGTITCNYDGVFKHRTVIGAGAFVGSNTMLVAPVRIGAGALTASGSVITEDVAAGDLALGRARQVAKAGQGAALRSALLEKKRQSTEGQS